MYNVEQYLHYDIESLLKQTYKNFEIILVNDGSTDNSGNLCDYYAQNHENVFVYHKENGGLSDARNYGVKKANGEFITFLDPDDYLENYSLELLSEIQKRYGCDLVSTRVKPTELYNNYSEHVLVEKDFENILLMDRDTFLEEAFYDKVVTVSACGKLYRKEVLDIEFPKGKIYEGLYIISDHLSRVNNIVHTNIQIYNYYKRPGSIVNSQFSEKQYDFFEATAHNRQIIIEKYNNTDKLMTAVNAKEVIGSFRIINGVGNNKKNLLRIRKKIIKNFKSLIFNKKISLKIKVKYIVFLSSFTMYRFLKGIIKK